MIITIQYNIELKNSERDFNAVEIDIFPIYKWHAGGTHKENHERANLRIKYFLSWLNLLT